MKNKEFQSEWKNDIKELDFIPEDLPWVNIPQIDQTISVDI